MTFVSPHLLWALLLVPALLAGYLLLQRRRMRYAMRFTNVDLLANLVAWPVAGYLMQRWLETFAYHISLHAWMFVAAGAAAVTIALLTVVGHALLVAHAQPVRALRYE